MSVNATIIALGLADFPWRYGLRIQSADGDIFQAFISDLKQCVPPRRRKWDPDDKRWLFREDAMSTVVYLLRRHDLTYIHADTPDEQTAPQLPMGIPDAYRALWLVPGCPPELVTAAHRTLAKLHHPDTPNGDTAMQQKLNAARDLLKDCA